MEAVLRVIGGLAAPPALVRPSKMSLDIAKCLLWWQNLSQLRSSAVDTKGNLTGMDRAVGPTPRRRGYLVYAWKVEAVGSWPAASPGRGAQAA